MEPILAEAAAAAAAAMDLEAASTAKVQSPHCSPLCTLDIFHPVKRLCPWSCCNQAPEGLAACALTCNSGAAQAAVDKAPKLSRDEMTKMRQQRDPHFQKGNAPGSAGTTAGKQGASATDPLDPPASSAAPAGNGSLHCPLPIPCSALCSCDCTSVVLALSRVWLSAG